ncbi:MAG: ROK family protein [Armatimonadetes bacterium]|nr:ROK family protein [Armatimonadota bacterium]
MTTYRKTDRRPTGETLAAAVGVDVGGTHVRAALVDREGHVLHHLRTGTPPEGGDALLAEVAGLVHALRHSRRGSTIEGIGVGTGGVVEPGTGRVLSATALIREWAGKNLAAEIEERCGHPCRVDNDGNAQALGELRYGAGQRFGHFVLITIGTGVGGGIVVDGRVYRGARGGAGEVGHVAVPGGGPCSCGRRDCLEGAVGGRAVERLWEERTGAPAADLFTRGPRDPDVDVFMRERAEILAVGIASVVNILNPQAVIVAGGPLYRSHLEWIQARVRELVLPACAAVEVMPSAVGEHLGVVGAAALVWEDG